VNLLAEEFIEWLKLPHDLQAKFFQEAENESNLIIRQVNEIARGLVHLTSLLQPHIRPLQKEDDQFVVTAVDSSRSPRLSERVGVRYGVLASGALTLKALERIEDRYEASVFKRKQAYSKDKSRYLFDLLATYAERKLALSAVEKSDIVLIDGSFFGFIYGGLRMKKEGLFGEEEQILMDKAFEMTKQLIESRKAMAVIKRSHSRAIGGWLALENKPTNPYTTLIDKFILSYIMPRETIFFYDDLLGSERHVAFYTYVSAMARRGLTQREDLVQEALERLYRPFDNLGFDRSGFDSLTRLQVKPFAGVSSCEIEYPRSIGLDKVQTWLGQPFFFNEGTGLPLALDLIDSLVDIPVSFTDEFVAEVEARAVEKLRGESTEALRLFFTYLNPQKPF
jgi:hypothetical protein